MARITNREITNLFISKFEQGRPFTPSENKMNGIKLAALKKTIKKFIEENNIETDLSVEQIIIDGIEFGAMKGMRYRSISSIGYQDLLPSIEFWKKRRMMEENKVEENKNNSQESIVIYGNTSYNEDKVKQPPSWLKIDKW